MTTRHFLNDAYQYGLEAQGKFDTDVAKERIEALITKARVEELNYIETHASGGGNWRRLIAQRLNSLTKEKP